MFGALNDRMTDELVTLAHTWQPDLVVYEALAPAGALAAALCEVPAVQHDVVLADTRGLRDQIYAEMTGAQQRHGRLDLPDDAGRVSLLPASMDGSQRDGWPTRYIPYNGGTMLPDWLLRPPERQRVAVTVGTVSAQVSGLVTVDTVVRAAAEVDLTIILAIGHTDPGELGPLPADVRTVGWMPLSELLPRCSAVIHHGGSGTVYNGLVAGIPQLVLPDGADRLINARAIVVRGVGLAASRDSLDATLVRRLLEDQEIRDSADEVRAELMAMPTPDTLVPLLSELAG